MLVFRGICAKRTHLIIHHCCCRTKDTWPLQWLAHTNKHMLDSDAKCMLLLPTESQPAANLGITVETNSSSAQLMWSGALSTVAQGCVTHRLLNKNTKDTQALSASFPMQQMVHGDATELKGKAGLFFKAVPLLWISAQLSFYHTAPL